MPADRLKFRQRELARAVRAMQSVGVEIERIEIDQETGKIIIVPKGNRPLTGWEDFKP